MTRPDPGPARLARLAAVVAATALGGLSALHLVWTISPWPLTNWPQWLSTVVGETDLRRLPPDWLTVIVAGLLAMAAWLVLARAGLARWSLAGRPLPAWMLRAGVWVVAAVLLARGAFGVVSTIVSHAGTRSFRTWDLWLYSPLTLALGLLAVVVALVAPAGRR